MSKKNMGKTKTAVMDDSQPVEEPKKKLGRQDDLIESLKAEFAGVGEKPQEESKSQRVKESKNSDSSESKTSDDSKSPKVTDDSVTPKKQAPKDGKSKPRSKKYQEKAADLDKTKTYSLNEAIELTKKNSFSKFTGTLEAHINTNQSNIRGLVSLPFASGRKLKILAFGKGAAESGADTAGTEETIEEINKGKFNYDLVVTTPDWMPKLAKVARILGPRGLMPNPKNGTITDDLKKAVEGFQAGKTEYKTEAKGFVIHLGLGKLDQPSEELSQNIKTLLQTLGKSRVKKVTLAPTMGPAVKLDLSSL